MQNPSQKISKQQWLALASVTAMSPAKWESLFQTLNVSPQHVLSAQVDRDLHGNPLSKSHMNVLQDLREKVNWSSVEVALEWESRHSNHHIITRNSPVWPTGFLSLDSAPLVLFARGDVSKLAEPQVAIVGSRMATSSGLANAKYFAEQLALAGVTITSGLASGIDSAAHKGAMTYEGRTIAFLGTGPDIVYPARNRALVNDMLESGALLVSEFFPKTPPRRYHFPRRNRLIAAISMGTLVVEARIKSGTLITANLAADLGREVFAIPGNIANPQSEGCHALIQQGAKLVVTAEHILEELSQLARLTATPAISVEEKSEDQNLATDKLLDSVEFDVTGVDIIAERSALPVSAVMAALLEYELRGLVASVPGGYVKLRGK